MLFELIDKLSTLADGPKVEFTLPSQAVTAPIDVEKRLAQFGIRMYDRSWDSDHSEDRTGTFSFKVRKRQFLWAYDILLSSGWPVLSPPPPNNRLKAMAANRGFAMSKKPQSAWGAPVRNNGLVAFFTNMWRGDMSIGMPPIKEQVKKEAKKQGRKIIKELFR